MVANSLRWRRSWPILRNQIKENYETREVDELIKQFEVINLADARLMRFLERLAQPS